MGWREGAEYQLVSELMVFSLRTQGYPVTKGNRPAKCMVPVSVDGLGIAK